MKKIVLSIALIASGLVASAQVGVGTENPQTSLHIVGANATDKGVTGENVPGALAATDGITVPVVTTEMTAPGTPVAGTKVGQMVYSNFAGKTGFYYWNGAAWVSVSSAAGIPDVNIASIHTETIIADTDFSANNATIFKITTSAGAGNFNITLPNPATNLGRLVVIANVGPTKGIRVTNAFDVTTATLATRSTGYISDGVKWISLAN